MRSDYYILETQGYVHLYETQKFRNVILTSPNLKYFYKCLSGSSFRYKFYGLRVFDFLFEFVIVIFRYLKYVRAEDGVRGNRTEIKRVQGMGYSIDAVVGTVQMSKWFIGGEDTDREPRNEKSVDLQLNPLNIKEDIEKLHQPYSDMLVRLL